MAKMNFKGVIEAALQISLILVQIIFGIAMIPIMIILTLALPGVAAWYIGTEMPDKWFIFEAISKIPVFISYILPLPWKKYFVKRFGVAYFGAKAQADYYLRCAATPATLAQMDEAGLMELWKRQIVTDDLLDNDAAKCLFRDELSDLDKAQVYLRTWEPRLLEMMSQEAIEVIWDNSQDTWEEIIRNGCHLQVYQFGELVQEKPGLVREYVRRNTPADEMLLAMAKNELLDELKYCAQQYGLSPKVIEALSPEVLEELAQPIRCFKQRTFLQRCKNPEAIQEFFRLVKTVEPNAQAVMEMWQYRIFHETGHELCPEVIHDVIRRQDIRWFTLILELDGENIGLSDQEEAIISTSPELTDAVFRYLVKRRREEASA